MSIRERLKLFVGDYVREKHPKLWKALAPVRGGVPPDTRVTVALLAPVVTALSDTRVSISRPASYILWVLTDKFTAAQHVVSQMSRDSRGHVRMWAVLSVGARAPRSLQLEVVGRGLSDRSALARRQTANQALTYHLRELLPDMVAAVARERNATVRQEIENCRRLLEYGYYITPSKSGQVVLTVAIDGGGIGSQFISRAELNERGVEAVVAAFQARHGRKEQAKPGTATDSTT